ncbi:tetratricopeptide repeat protein [Sulfuriroseicoccus oceanibius]|uniref:Tetratricopeptide repeat protein n=1 Tax=Sulfuriroseicoccus oceanibius TaxID=2707525 RepID=A0A6B3LCH0_9BACT|nr:tetratricopeptide repeat protein [Sulfuriroseicoccus oceanibius]QQL44662.1 tetratricopeptide repeat protein [Sulfuriroseicoccus oceanibius]
MSARWIQQLKWKPLAIGASVLVLAYCGTREAQEASKAARQEVKPVGHPLAVEQVYTKEAGASRQPVRAISHQCLACHQDYAEKWKHSHHALANRLVSKERDAEAFAAAGIKVPGGEKWQFQWKAGERPSADVSSPLRPDGKTWHFDMAIGETPLIQYLTQSDKGRWQTTRTAWAPETKTWIDTTPQDDRSEGEWGHWLGRGMNWNANCAYCHMTNFHKGYDVATDTYHSTWDEMSIGCTQCHGGYTTTPVADTGCLIRPGMDPMLGEEDVVMDACASCHSRRGEFDDEFKAGKKYGDHYHLTLPTHPTLYYADGQILNEDYVWASLKMSKMGHAGVGCLDCHDPHTAAIKYPIENNALCLQCHGGGVDGATVINPTAHSFHKDGSTGNMCVECHMPSTVYMGNDPRRDHGFHSPDPLLTKELGIPNACNKCHDDQSVDWAIEWVDKWYGDKMERPERERTRAVQLAYDGDPVAIEKLLVAYDGEEIPLWRASLLELMEPWARDERVLERVRAAMDDEDYLVRVACARLARTAGALDVVRKLVEDPMRSVRMEAGWAFTQSLPDDSPLMKELMSYLNHVADQPTGALRRAEILVSRGEFSAAEEWYDKVIAWDPSSVAGYQAKAVYLSRLGRGAEALKLLEKATDVEPDNGYLRFLLGLGYSEALEANKAGAAFLKAVELEPDNPRYHYNYGLHAAGANDLETAATHLKEAERLAPDSPDYPFALATIYYRLQKTNEAISAAERALQINPQYRPAADFLRVRYGIQK